MSEHHAEAETPQSEMPEPEYAVVEVFGHRKHAGRVYEVERFGTKLCRVDIPKDGKFENGFTTHYYGGASIFSMSPCDLATVEKANRPYEPAGRLTYSALDDIEEEDF